MDNKVIFIKLKEGVCKSIQYFEDSFTAFTKGNHASNNYYNFITSGKSDYMTQLTDGNEYYFFALVYKENEIKKAFLGVGTFIVKNEKRSLRIVTEYNQNKNNTIENLVKLSDLSIKNDFSAGEYVTIEDSEYLFSQIDFILSDYRMPGKIEREYESISSESGLHRLAQKNEYCRRQYNLREPQEGRGEFQRDYERIIHSRAFRRMVDKAQVFSASKGDYYRTRMTHSQAVAQIARGIASELNLNLVLTEAIALGHDLGHTPFGHQGERTLNDILTNEIHIIKNADLFEDHFGGFKHNYQSVRVASMLEEEYFEIEGMDLSYQTLEGMIKHTKLKREEFKLNEFITDENAETELKFDTDVCSTLEGQIVAVADEIAQRGHDLDDALSSEIMSFEDFKKYLDFKKLEKLKDIINDLLGASRSTNCNRKIYPDKKELMNSRVVSAVISYFINDVIATSKKNMESYSSDLFNNNGHTVNKRIIDFSEDAYKINNYLEMLIANKVINCSEVSLFDNNGATIVCSLFKAYYNNPRLIHKGTQRRIYAETRLHTPNVVNFELGNHTVIRNEIKKITCDDLSDENEELSNDEKKEYMMKRRILVRNICDYISGMTDTYAINEYRNIER